MLLLSTFQNKCVNEISLKSKLPASDEDESPSEGSLEESQSEASEGYDLEEEWDGITQDGPVITDDQEPAAAEIPILRPAGMLHPAEPVPTSLTHLQAPTYLHIYERSKNLMLKPFRSLQGS